MAGQLAQVLAGLNWLVQTRFAQGHVSVINGSLSSGAYDRFCYDPLLDARNLQGILFVAAIGNQGPLPDRHGSPGNYDCAVGVGAVDENDVVASFSDCTGSSFSIPSGPSRIYVRPEFRFRVVFLAETMQL